MERIGVGSAPPHTRDTTCAKSHVNLYHTYSTAPSCSTSIFAESIVAYSFISACCRETNAWKIGENSTHGKVPQQTAVTATRSRKTTPHTHSQLPSKAPGGNLSSTASSKRRLKKTERERDSPDSSFVYFGEEDTWIQSSVCATTNIRSIHTISFLSVITFCLQET